MPSLRHAVRALLVTAALLGCGDATLVEATEEAVAARGEQAIAFAPHRADVAG